jgi:hypothetical protein
MSSAISAHVREFLLGRGQDRTLAGAVAVVACLLLVLQIQQGAMRIASYGRDRATSRAVRAISLPLALIFSIALIGHFARFFQ